MALTSVYFFLISVGCGLYLFGKGHINFALILWISDLLLFAFSSRLKRKPSPKTNLKRWHIFLCFFPLFLLLAHFTFRGVYSWDYFRNSSAVNELQFHSGGEILLGFVVLILATTLIFKQMTELKND